MIGKLTGVLDSYGEDFIVVDVHGVGYLVHCSARTLQALPGAGEAVTLAIETHVREDQIRLFGFLSDVEREWFRLLQTAECVRARRPEGPLLDPADPQAGRSRQRHRAARQGDDHARARGRPQGG